MDFVHYFRIRYNEIKNIIKERKDLNNLTNIDKRNIAEGYFLAYKSLCKRIADIVVKINPDFRYPRAFASMLIETANNNIFFAQHLPRLTDIREKGDQLNDKVVELLEFIAGKMIVTNAAPEMSAQQKD